MSNRFNKKSLVSDLRLIAKNVNKKFDESNGTAQLWPRNCSDEIKELIQKAADYGRWRALNDAAKAVEGGEIGIG